MSDTEFNLADAYSVIRLLEETGSTKEKLQILKDNSGNEVLRNLLYYTYEPTLNFYQSNVASSSDDRFDYTYELSRAFKVLQDVSDTKIRGNSGKRLLSDVHANLIGSDSVTLFERMVKRDMRCGINVSTINKVWPDLISTWPYMRCGLVSKKTLENISWPAYSEVKCDGMYTNVTCLKDSVEFHTRNGNIIHAPRYLEDSFAGEHDVVFNGEMLVYDPDGKVLPREIGNGICNSLISGGEVPAGHVIGITVWDSMPLEAYENGIHNVQRSKRLIELQAATNRIDSPFIKMVEFMQVRSFEEAYAHYKEMVLRGEEGTVLKDASGIWKNGTPKHQLKMKVAVDIDLKIVGYRPGKGKNEATFGSLLCESSDGLLRVGVSGFKDAVRKKLWSRMQEHIDAGRIITCRSNCIMKPTASNDKYSLFLPRYVEDRFNEKTEADTVERIEEMFASSSILQHVA